MKHNLTNELNFFHIFSYTVKIFLMSFEKTIVIIKIVYNIYMKGVSVNNYVDCFCI